MLKHTRAITSHFTSRQDEKTGRAVEAHFTSGIDEGTGTGSVKMLPAHYDVRNAKAY